MKFPGLGMDRSTKENFLGGIAGSLTFWMEEAAYELVSGYPQELRQRIDPNLPRNGQLVATVAPLSVAWVAPKVLKRHSARMENLKMGITMYSAPKLVHTLVTTMAYFMGVANPQSLRTTSLFRINNTVGKFAMAPTATPTPVGYGLGRYKPA